MSYLGCGQFKNLVVDSALLLALSLFLRYFCMVRRRKSELVGLLIVFLFYVSVFSMWCPGSVVVFDCIIS